MRTMFPILFTFTVLIAVISPAQSAETVFGNSDAQRCFEGARYGAGRNGEGACNRALMPGALSKSDRAATLVNRGIIYNRTRRLEEAVADFNAALEIDPGLGEAYLNRGNTRFFQRRMEEAKADYGKAIELKSRDLHAAYFNRGLVYEVLQDKEAARADFEAALRVKPDFVAAQAKLSGATE